MRERGLGRGGNSHVMLQCPQSVQANWELWSWDGAVELSQIEARGLNFAPSYQLTSTRPWVRALPGKGLKFGQGSVFIWEQFSEMDWASSYRPPTHLTTGGMSCLALLGHLRGLLGHLLNTVSSNPRGENILRKERWTVWNISERLTQRRIEICQDGGLGDLHQSNFSGTGRMKSNWRDWEENGRWGDGYSNIDNSSEDLIS